MQFSFAFYMSIHVCQCKEYVHLCCTERTQVSTLNLLHCWHSIWGQHTSYIDRPYSILPTYMMPTYISLLHVTFHMCVKHGTSMLYQHVDYTNLSKPKEHVTMHEATTHTPVSGNPSQVIRDLNSHINQQVTRIWRVWPTLTSTNLLTYKLS